MQMIDDSYKGIGIKAERKTLTITIITKDEVSEADQLEIKTRVSGEICVEFVREVNNYRYYLIQRGPGPFCQPKGCINTKDYNDKIYVEEIGYNAWGYAEYDRKLTVTEISDYELIIEGE